MEAAANASSNAGAVTAESIVAQARTMMPRLRERAQRTEERRRIPAETHHEFIESGFYRILQPARYGGFELDYGTQTEMSVELAMGCASSGWIASITACHAWIAGMFPPAVQERIWGDDAGTLIASAFQPPGDYRIERATGGWRVAGRWKFSSGVELCQWAVIATPIPAADGKGPPERQFALVPLDEAAIEDVWFVSGLAGTGSNDIVLRDVFIPDAHTLKASECAGGPTPGSAINPCHIYRLPLFGVFPYNLVGVGIGAAIGAVELVIEQLKVRSTATMHLRMAALQSAQLRIARAAASADAARVLIRTNCVEMNARARAGLPLGPEHRVRYRRDAGFASLLFLEAVQGVFPLLGGGGLAAGNPIQRQWRDAHAVGQHIACSWDAAGSHYGAAVLGVLPPEQM
ncbi:MAG TPA: acyl-CoA dehydrogenase family protein [Stellaceae bacterium]|nr:acyl-CoA dehydrogenase family protein [Stellaceae bacterium]